VRGAAGGRVKSRVISGGTRVLEEGWAAAWRRARWGDWGWVAAASPMSSPGCSAHPASLLELCFFLVGQTAPVFLLPWVRQHTTRSAAGRPLVSGLGGGGLWGSAGSGKGGMHGGKRGNGERAATLTLPSNFCLTTPPPPVFAVAYFGYLLSSISSLVQDDSPAARRAAAIRERLQARRSRHFHSRAAAGGVYVHPTWLHGSPALPMTMLQSSPRCTASCCLRPPPLNACLSVLRHFSSRTSRHNAAIHNAHPRHTHVDCRKWRAGWLAWGCPPPCSATSGSFTAAPGRPQWVGSCVDGVCSRVGWGCGRGAPSLPRKLGVWEFSCMPLVGGWPSPSSRLALPRCLPCVLKKLLTPPPPPRSFHPTRTSRAGQPAAVRRPPPLAAAAPGGAAAAGGSAGTGAAALWATLLRAAASAGARGCGLQAARAARRRGAVALRRPGHHVLHPG
jgi:hypothetical protein